MSVKPWHGRKGLKSPWNIIMTDDMTKGEEIEKALEILYKKYIDEKDKIYLEFVDIKVPKEKLRRTAVTKAHYFDECIDDKLITTEEFIELMKMALRMDLEGFRKRITELAEIKGKGIAKRIDVQGKIGKGKGLYDQFKNKISKASLGCG